MGAGHRKISVKLQMLDNVNNLNRRFPQVTVTQDAFYDFVDRFSSRVVHPAHSW
jgi:hypothetical protein